MAVHLAFAGDVFNGVLFCANEVSWMKSGTELSQFLRIFLPTFDLRVAYQNPYAGHLYIMHFVFFKSIPQL